MFRSSLYEAGWSWADIELRSCANGEVGLGSHSLSHSFPVPNKPYGFCERKTLWTIALWTKARKALWTTALWTKARKALWTTGLWTKARKALWTTALWTKARKSTVDQSNVN